VPEGGRIDVTVRYFAAARAATGIETEMLRVPAGMTFNGLVEQLGTGRAELAKVLARCSFLCDGVAVRNRTEALETARTLDVLPPFAGG
jgi:molybdopterin synthase sulfur carrier subunit